MQRGLLPAYPGNEQPEALEISTASASLNARRFYFH
jgi:hypothetical protein